MGQKCLFVTKCLPHNFPLEGTHQYRIFKVEAQKAKVKILYAGDNEFLNVSEQKHQYKRNINPWGMVKHNGGRRTENLVYNKA